jgi:hypothetical protein
MIAAAAVPLAMLNLGAAVGSNYGEGGDTTKGKKGNGLLTKNGGQNESAGDEDRDGGENIVPFMPIRLVLLTSFTRLVLSPMIAIPLTMLLVNRTPLVDGGEKILVLVLMLE